MPEARHTDMLAPDCDLMRGCLAKLGSVRVASNPVGARVTDLLRLQH